MPPRIEVQLDTHREAPPEGEPSCELDNTRVAILDQIAVGTHAATIRSSLLADGHDEATIDAMVAEGWLVVWNLSRLSKEVLKRLRAWLPKNMADTQLISISPWAAERLRLEIVQEGANERPRWGKMIDEELLSLGLPQPTSPLPSYARLPTQPDHYEAILFTVFRLPGDIPDKALGPAEEAAERETVAMREDVEEHYDPERDEITRQVVRRPVVQWGKLVPIDRRMGGGRKVSKKKIKGKKR